MYIPDEMDRDARGKLTIIKTETDTCKSVDRQKQYKRRKRLFQCQCGVDHTEGHRGGKKREIGWPNVGCRVWIRLATTHDESDKNNPILLTIYEILGDFCHSAECLDTESMDRNPRILLHPPASRTP
ncbi:hypothetical protein B0H14DRAFT_2631156 [Mycena olivaceomarginata]|nr:hypothetical protein B0H14DRAFT_2631156 [Mycena olivaceomarginata]